MIPIITIIEKTAEVIMNGQSRKPIRDGKWKRFRTDLEGLTVAQRNLVFKLVEQMKAVNKEDAHLAILRRKR